MEDKNKLREKFLDTDAWYEEILRKKAEDECIMRKKIGLFCATLGFFICFAFSFISIILFLVPLSVLAGYWKILECILNFGK